jgi:hypothetical protein
LYYFVKNAYCPTLAYVLKREFLEDLSDCTPVCAMTSVILPSATVPSTIKFAEILLQDVVKDGLFCKKPFEWCGRRPLVGRL